MKYLMCTERWNWALSSIYYPRYDK